MSYAHSLLQASNICYRLHPVHQLTTISSGGRYDYVDDNEDDNDDVFENLHHPDDVKFHQAIDVLYHIAEIIRRAAMVLRANRRN